MPGIALTAALNADTGGTRSYWVSRRGVGELRSEILDSRAVAGQSLLKTQYSGVSAGTERLVGLGLVPKECADSMACRYMGGDFQLPIKYGYDLVGRGVSGSLEGQTVFVMHPHQELVRVEDQHAVVLPERLDPKRAVLIPNLETALNGVWDADPHPGEKAVVVGGGAVGLLVAYVLSSRHEPPITVAESDPNRMEFIRSLPWIDRVVSPDQLVNEDFGIAFHTSGTPQGLQASLEALGFEGRVVELSWYGRTPVTLSLGTHFHYQRKRIISSQVAAIAPSRRDQCTYKARLEKVIDLLGESSLDGLISEPIHFEQMPDFMSDLYKGNVTHPVPLIQYDSA